jgi:hypothetical protein
MSSLLENTYEDFTIINKSVVDDGYGSVDTVWRDGATIKGAIIYNNSVQMKVAQALGVTATYKFIVKKGIELDYLTVIRRESDKKIFRLTTNSDDLKTPPGAGINARVYEAEEWKL